MEIVTLESYLKCIQTDIFILPSLQPRRLEDALPPRRRRAVVGVWISRQLEAAPGVGDAQHHGDASPAAALAEALRDHP